MSDFSEQIGAMGPGLMGEVVKYLPMAVALVCVNDPDNVRSWKLTTANLLAKQIIGNSLADFLLRDLAKSFPFKKKMEDLYQQVLQRRTAQHLHWLACDIGGLRRTFSVMVFPVPPDHIGFLMQDVTNYTELRKRLAAEKNRHDVLDQAIQSFLWKGDPETLQTTWVSQEAEQMLGYWPERWMNMPNFWVEHIHPDDRATVVKLVKQITRNGTSGIAKFDYRMNAAGGGSVWLHAVMHMDETAVGCRELAGVMVDITARKMAEEAAHELSGKLLRSQDDERRHIARELHDSLGQYLSVLNMNVGTLARTVLGLTEQQRKMFAETVDLLETCSREVRTVSYLMHPPMLDEVGLVSALLWYAKGFSERCDIQVKIDAADISKRLPKLVETAFFRITQEALTNIYRHSQSQTAVIRLQECDGGIAIEIADNGSGLDADLLESVGSENGGPKGVGIRGMRERMREMGGTLHLVSNKSGTLICAHIPWTSSVFAEKNAEEHDALSVPAASAQNAG
jgi:PAS domain S-box-containing protein